MSETGKKISMIWNKKKNTVLRRKLKRIRGRAAAEIAALEIGDQMADGTIYAGISPDTHRPIYAAPDASDTTMNFKHAEEFAARLDVSGKKDFRLPTANELKVLFDNRERGAFKGTFNRTGAKFLGYYWASEPADAMSLEGRRFSEKNPDNFLKIFVAAVRCVR